MTNARTAPSGSPRRAAPATPRPRAPTALAALRKTLPADVDERLKAIACHLFARRGIDGVTIREILTTARIKNFGAVGYYFGSKENLVRQILVDGAQEIDVHRAELLDRLEASGAPIDIRAIIDILIHAVVDLPSIENKNLICFIQLVGVTHRELYVTAMAEHPTPAFERCIAHLVRLMPAMPAAARNQRLMFMKVGMAAVLARRETALATRGKDFANWRGDETLRQYARSLTAMLAALFDEAD